jgi:periplasmic divalent cation tolerance protein
MLVTAPDSDVAESLARTLVGERLAACVNVLPNIVSIYRWDGQVQQDSEFLLLIKTRAELCDRLSSRVVELHPYDVPEAVALPIVGGSPAYLEWVATEAAG